ncbi:MAG TPA: hypothetical protein VFM25_14435, partial [Verrucomicrobiae bacterium]|nr:hypothetical protein [Verrucomicrobiae bacterium]
MARVLPFRTFVFSALSRATACFRPAARDKSQAIKRNWQLTDSERSAYHFALLEKDSEIQAVDERTWSDLEMDLVFARLDKAITPLGAQYFYAFLKTPQPDPGCRKENVRVCRAFTSNPNRAQKLSAALAPLNRDAAAGLSDFLFRTKLTVPKGSRIFYPLSAISVLCPFGMFFSPFFFWPSLALWILNIVLHCRFNSSVVRHRPSLATLAILLKSVPAIADSIQSLELPEERELSEAAPVAIEIRKSISKTLLLFSGGDDLTRIFKEYLNVLCLFDLCSLCKAIEAVKRERRMLGEIFRIVARLDACRAFSAATSESLVCAAEFTNARALEFTDVYHPLIPNAVCNSIRSDGNSVLLSGTNMAGKTTFMKALGINVLLARTIGLCFARKAILPDVIVKTL